MTSLRNCGQRFDKEWEIALNHHPDWTARHWKSKIYQEAVRRSPLISNLELVDWRMANQSDRKRASFVNEPNGERHTSRNWRPRANTIRTDRSSPIPNDGFPNTHEAAIEGDDVVVDPTNRHKAGDRKQMRRDWMRRLDEQELFRRVLAPPRPT